MKFWSHIILLACVLTTMSRAVAAEEREMRSDVLLYEAVVSGTKVKVVASEQAFDPGKHKTTEPKNEGTEEQPRWVGATVDGKPVIGTDQTLPREGLPQLARLAVHFGDRVVEVPPALLSHVFLPHFRQAGAFTLEHADTIISVSTDAKCVLIDLGVGDGGGTSTVFFAVSSDGKASAEPPKRPEP